MSKRHVIYQNEWGPFLARLIDENFDNIHQEGLDPVKELKVAWIEDVAFASANVQVTVFHGLGRIPRGAYVVQRKLGGVIRGNDHDPVDATNQSTVWTTSYIYLVSDTASEIVDLIVF